MGEIYRSVSVTGTRMLATQRAERIAKDKTEKATVTDKEPSGSEPSGPAKQKPSQQSFEKEVLADKTQVQVESASQRQAATDSVLEKDLFDIQQKRLDQLEQEKQALEQSLNEQLEQVKQAQSELKSLAEAQESKGYQAGYQKAVEEVEKQSQKKLAELNQLMALFSDTLDSQVEKVDEYAVEIAFSALGRIVGEQQANAVFTRAVVTEALSAVRGDSKVVVRVSQSDFEVLESIQGDLASGGQFVDFQLVPDPRVSVGGCLIETDNGAWDARLETQLLRLKDSVEQSLKKHQ